MLLLPTFSFDFLLLIFSNVISSFEIFLSILLPSITLIFNFFGFSFFTFIVDKLVRLLDSDCTSSFPARISLRISPSIYLLSSFISKTRLFSLFFSFFAVTYSSIFCCCMGSLSLLRGRPPNMLSVLFMQDLDLCFLYMNFCRFTLLYNCECLC